jgi:calcineurin-like phosphoesterase family protein
MSARIFVISDTHFGHENMYTFVTFDGVTRVREAFASAVDADAEMVRRWNATVTPQDHVYHLGDVAMGSQALRIVQHLNGHKRLILGNHDREPVLNYRGVGFQKVMGCHQFRRGIWFTHIPMHSENLGPAGINVHGHIHEKEPFSPQHRNVSVERVNYTPVLLESVLAE